MTQQSHVQLVAGAAPVDLTVGLDDATYIVQVREGGPVLYATAPTAPADPFDYFEAPRLSTFLVEAGPEAAPTWVQATGGSRVAIGRWV